MRIGYSGRTSHSLPGAILALYLRSMEADRPPLDVGSETTLAEVPAQLQEKKSEMHAVTLSQASWLPSTSLRSRPTE